MPFKKATRLCAVYFLAAVMVWVPTLTPAEMLDTGEVFQSLSDNAQKRKWLAAMVSRQEAREQLQKFGVSPSEALSRINSMTDEEVASVMDQIEQYAGAGDPLWRVSGDKDAGYIFVIIVGVLVIGCLAFCWLIFI